MDQVRLAGVMLAAGVGIPVLAALNAQLGTRIGSSVTAGVALFAVAFVAASGLMLMTGGAGRLSLLPGQPKGLFLAGLLVAFYVLSVTWAAPKLGLGTAILFVLMGQLLSSSVIDHFGFFGARLNPLSPQRTAGLAAMALGMVLAVRG
jgi:bacterial/archaeal transporter family-2 protein